MRGHESPVRSSTCGPSVTCRPRAHRCASTRLARNICLLLNRRPRLLSAPSTHLVLSVSSYYFSLKPEIERSAVCVRVVCVCFLGKHRWGEVKIGSGGGIRTKWVWFLKHSSGTVVNARRIGKECLKNALRIGKGSAKSARWMLQESAKYARRISKECLKKRWPRIETYCPCTEKEVQ
jgi:hypothetical protein